MDSPFNITLERNGNDKERIGPNKRSKFSASSAELEKLFKQKSPLPVTFDVAPIHDNYFTEFSYFDILGGVFLTTLSGEVTAILVEKAVAEAEPDYSLVEILAQNISDKYELSSNIQPVDNLKVAFLPGSNLMSAVNRELLDRCMYEDESMLIKLHPITNEETIRQVARNYGYGRLLSHQESGVGYLKNCGTVYTASNSEFGIAASALKKPMVDITSVLLQPKLSYSPIYRLLKNNDPDHNYTVLAKLLNSKASGIIMPWFKDNELRINTFYSEAMKVREMFRPRYASTAYRYSIGKVDNAVRKN